MHLCSKYMISCDHQTIEGDEYQKVLVFMTQVLPPTTWVFFYVGKDVRIKYASSNFCLHLYHME